MSETSDLHGIPGRCCADWAAGLLRANGDVQPGQRAGEGSSTPCVVDILLAPTPEALFGSLAGSLRTLTVDLLRLLGAVRQDDHLVVADFGESTGDGETVLVTALTVGQLADPQRRQEGRVTSQNTEVTLAAGSNNLVDHVRHDQAHGRRDLELEGVGHSALAAKLLGLVDGLTDVTDHVEGLLGQFVLLAVHDLAEALYGIGDLHVAGR